MLVLHLIVQKAVLRACRNAIEFNRQAEASVSKLCMWTYMGHMGTLEFIGHESMM